MNRNVTIKDFLTDREIKLAIQLKTAGSICDQIIKPNIARINRALGQQNDPMYLAYAVEFIVSQYKKNS